MDTVQKVVLVAHTLIAVLIIVLVLLQRGKGADAGAAFGAGASGTVFGARGSASFFSRMTAVFATLFFVSSLTLAWLSSQQVTTAPGSLLDDPALDGPAEAVPADPALDDDALPSIEVPADDAGEDLPSLEAPEPAGEDAESADGG